MPGRRFGRGRTYADKRFDSGEVLNQLILEFREGEGSILSFALIFVADPRADNHRIILDKVRRCFQRGPAGLNTRKPSLFEGIEKSAPPVAKETLR